LIIIVNTYEALIVFKPATDVENTEAVVKNVENLVANLKGKVLKLEKVGRKRLAYEIAKCKDGFIATLWMELDPSAVADFKKACQLNEEILRLTLVRLEKFDLATVGTTTSVAYGGAQREREFHPRGDREHRGGDREHRGGDREHRGEHRHEHREHRPGGFGGGGEHRGEHRPGHGGHGGEQRNP
jgi:small subunit ribosomal protein S6